MAYFKDEIIEVDDHLDNENEIRLRIDGKRGEADTCINEAVAVELINHLVNVFNIDIVAISKGGNHAL